MGTMTKNADLRDRARQWPSCTLGHCGHGRTWETEDEARVAAGDPANRDWISPNGSAACGCHGGPGTFTCSA